ncbi:MAG: hypothetical protein M1816_005052 [Peltula sp. TS41687]|nr:MAG: hypothetical protein M1816_005052 [Peltula sp. TS41687]
MFILIILLLAGLGPWGCRTADSSPAPYRKDANPTSHDYPVTIVHQFPPGIWVENLAVRRNGLIIAISGTSPLLYQLDPESPPSSEPTVLYDFSAAGDGLRGIVEVDEDVFAVEVSDCSQPVLALVCPQGSTSVWEVDLQGYYGSRGRNARVRKAAEVPSELQLNGMATLKRGSDALVLIADSQLGVVWKLAMHTGENSVVIRDDSMVGSAGVPPVGINGLHIRGDRLWFTNSAKGTLNVMPIDPATGEKRGEAKVMTLGPFVDDFELGEDEAYVCKISEDQLLAVGPLRGGAAATVRSVAELAGPTSARWGRSRIDRARRSLYASSTGGLAQWGSGNVTVGGSLARIDLRG